MTDWGPSEGTDGQSPDGAGLHWPVRTQQRGGTLVRKRLPLPTSTPNAARLQVTLIIEATCLGFSAIQFTDASWDRTRSWRRASRPKGPGMCRWGYHAVRVSHCTSGLSYLALRHSHLHPREHHPLLNGAMPKSPPGHRNGKTLAVP